MLNSIKTLSHWLKWIDCYQGNDAIFLGLERIYSIATQMRIHRFSCPIIVVGGTNGKGTTIASMESILLAAGKKVASFTSPHFFSFTERIRIQGEPVSELQCCKAFTELTAHTSLTSPLSYFEFATLVALWIFHKEPLDILLLEVGLGGRLDAVNIIHNNVSIITSIGLDHCEYLGNTINSIALEKAGIIKPDSVSICGQISPPTVISSTAHLQNTKYLEIEKDFGVVVNSSSNDWTFWTHSYEVDQLSLTPFPMSNAACAIKALTSLDLNISNEAIRKGIKQVNLPGRYQICRLSPMIIIDVAHNEQAANWLCTKLKSTKGIKNFNAVFGVLESKNWESIVKPFINFINYWYTTPIKSSHSMDVTKLTENLKLLTEGNVLACDSVYQALKTCLYSSAKEDCVLVFGSFFTVTEAIEYLYGMEHQHFYSKLQLQ